MERFFRGLLNHRKLVVVIFLVAAVLSAMCYPQVSVNGDFSKYLPEDCESTIAIDKMGETFDGDVSNARVYVEGISMAQAEELDQEYCELDGVIDCSWLGDNVDTSEPLEVQDEDTVSTWKDDEGYVFELTLEEPYEQEEIDLVRSVAEGVEGAGDVAIDGNAADTAEVLYKANSQIMTIMIIAVIVVLVMMSLATTSFLYPVIALLSIGIAIIINLGTNIVQGEISSITMLVSAVLQLAVSMDYSIVFLSTYASVLAVEKDEFEAIVKTCTQSFSVVISSAAVTFFGFVSLCVMRFTIGVDMGIVLSKGIVCSFLSIMFLMPCLLYMFRKPASKVTHKPIFGHVNGFANVCRKLAIPAAVIVAIIIVPCYFAQDMTNFTYGQSANVDPEGELGQEEQLLEEKFGEEQMWVIMVPEGEWANENALVEDLQDLPTTTNVVSYSTAAGSATPTALGDEEEISQLINNGYSRLILTSDVGQEGDETFQLVQDVRDMCAGYYGDEYYLVGDSVSTYDIMTVAKEDSVTIRLASMIAIALVLLFMFRSISLPIILVFTIEMSIWINLAVPYFLDQSITYIGYLVIDAVQLGAAVDYSIIYTHEYLKLRKQMTARVAANKAIAHTTLPILTSSLILMLATLGMYVAVDSPMIDDLMLLLCRGAFLADVLIFLILPSLFIVFDWVIRHTSIGLGFYVPAKESPGAEPSASAEALPEGASSEATPEETSAGEAESSEGSEEETESDDSHGEKKKKDADKKKSKKKKKKKSS